MTAVSGEQSVVKQDAAGAVAGLEKQRPVHLPAPTIWPAPLAAGVTLMAFGVASYGSLCSARR